MDDTFDAKQEARRGGAFVYTGIYGQLQRKADEERVEPKGTARYSARTMPPQLSVDTPAVMNAVLDGSAPAVRSGAAAAETAAEAASPLQQRRRPRAAAARPEESSSLASPYLRELRSRLDECAAIAAAEPNRDAAAAAHHRNNAGAAVAKQRQPHAAEVAHAPRSTAAASAAATSPLCPVDEWVRRHVEGTAATAPATASVPGSASSQVAAARKMQTPLFTQLSNARFPSVASCRSTPMIAPVERPQPGSGTPLSSVLLTEVRVGAPSRPHSAGNVPALESSLLDELKAEPICSYRLLRDVGTRPASRLVRRGHGPNTSLLTSGAVAKENLARSRHMFEYARYEKQAELVSFLRWRDACKTAVEGYVDRTDRRDGCHGSATEAPPLTRMENHAAMSKKVDATLSVLTYTGEPLVAGQVHSIGGRSRPTSGQSERSASAAVPRVGSAGSERGAALSSIWSRSATILAAEAACEEMCGLLRSFQPSFPVASLSREAMETLKSHLIAHVRAKPLPGRYTKTDLKAYLGKNFPPIGVTRGTAHSMGVTDSDYVDAMPSPAEAALVRYALDILAE